jgi:hypothetical protein
MGFVIKTETERNPISQGPTPEQTRIQELEAEVKQHNDFLEENGYAIKFDMWKDLKEQIQASGVEVIVPKMEGEYVDFEEIKPNNE